MMNGQAAELQALYDPLSDTPTAGLFDKYRVLREKHPVYYNSVRDVWCLSRYEDVFHAARDWRTFTTTDGVDLDVPAHFYGAGDFLETDPPLHDYLRNVVRAWFTPAAVRGLEERIDGRVTSLLGALDSDEVDLASSFAWEIPIWVVSTILGIPIHDLDVVRTWLEQLTVRVPGSDTAPPVAFEALNSLHSYLAALAKERSRRPADDLLTTLGQAVERKELTVDELTGTSLLLFQAGSETAASLVASGLHLLDTHRDQQAAVRAGEVDLAAAIEEILRYESPIQQLKRTTTCEVVLHGTRIPQGARVLLLYGSANRDERKFASPDVFDVHRNPRQHLAFGNGIHACVGAPLARLEGEIALRRFFEHVKSYEITGAPERFQNPVVRAIVSLPAVITRA